jgi:leader peptidase (prepilin peptidase) / N-methyltransferase
MEALAVIFVLAAGLSFGSFLNVCISRLPPHESIVRPGSRCPNCGAAIAMRDNIPLLSFILLRGRCRACRRPIAWRYPAIELATAALWLLCWLKFGFTLEALGTAVLSFLLLGLAAMDAETMLLPDTFTLPGIVLGILYSGLICGRIRCALLSAAWAAAAAAIILAISGAYWLIRKQQGMGMGDAKLAALIAAWLGPIQGLLVLFLGVLAAALYGIGVSIVRRRFDATAPLPLGSFLCAAALFALFQGQHALAWYASFFR